MALVSYPEGRISRPMALRTRPSIVRSLPGIALVPLFRWYPLRRSPRLLELVPRRSPMKSLTGRIGFWAGVALLLLGNATPAQAQYMRLTTDNPTDNTRLRAAERRSSP